jgi:reactive intermediate/imine deaminase
VTRTLDAAENAAPLGPYSHAATDGVTLWTAGQIPVTASGTVLTDVPIEEQTEQALANVERILEAEELETGSVRKTTVYMTDLDEIERMNTAYRSYFGTDPPARTAVEVSRIADGAAIEIEAVASLR